MLHEETTMRRLILSFCFLACSSAVANAQFPQQPAQGGLTGQYGPYDLFWQNANPNNFMPNIYNPQTQPLSPYLYSVRNNNPAVDYYFGTRPGTIGGGSRGYGGAPFIAPGGNRTLFFPQLASAPEPFQTPGVTQGAPSVLPPAGHQAVFNNTLGFYPSPFGQAGGSRLGIGGMGGQSQQKK
jgi:hypothetical protein